MIWPFPAFLASPLPPHQHVFPLCPVCSHLDVCLPMCYEDHHPVCNLFLARAGPRTCLSDFFPSRERSLLTFFPCGEELLDAFIEADPKRGKAYLSLEASRQPVVEFHWPSCFCQSGDCSQDTFIPNSTGGLAFALDLEMRKVQVRGK